MLPLAACAPRAACCTCWRTDSSRVDPSRSWFIASSSISPRMASVRASVVGASGDSATDLYCAASPREVAR